MSNERVYGLYKQLLGLAEDQLNALQEERFDEAFGYLERRQRMIDDIQSLDGEIINQREPIYNAIKNILSVDIDIQNLTRTNLNSLYDELCSVSKMKAFINVISYNQTGANLNLNI